MKSKTLSFEDVPQFSAFDKAYQTDAKRFEALLGRLPVPDSFSDQIEAKKRSFSFDRTKLVEIIAQQYSRLREGHQLIPENLEALKDENTFTIITAHQPSLFTGPLYYIFKIASAIVHARQLNNRYPDYHIVPVFIIGGEDHDFEEINHFYYRTQKFTWQQDEGGAVGRLSTQNIHSVLEELGTHLGSSFYGKQILDLLNEAYLGHKTLGDTTHFFISQLFKDTELVVAQMDESEFKRAFSPIIREEVTEERSQSLILDQQQKFQQLGFQPQAFVREINFFYLSPGGRHRIEQKGDRFIVVDTEMSLSAKEMLDEIQNAPERFSPNVVMRPIYQEFIFPNLAYVGGGGELAYWMDRKQQFEAFGLEFPILIRRHSAFLIKNKDLERLKEFPWELKDWLQDPDALIKRYIRELHPEEMDFTQSYRELNRLFDLIKPEMKKLNANYSYSVEAARVDALKTIQRLEKKALSALKRKEENAISKIRHLRNILIPEGKLQERHDNIVEWYQEYGPRIITDIIDALEAFDKEVKVLVTP